MSNGYAGIAAGDVRRVLPVSGRYHASVSIHGLNTVVFWEWGLSHGGKSFQALGFSVLILVGCSSAEKEMQSCIDRSEMGPKFNEELNMLLHERLAYERDQIPDLYPRSARQDRIEGTPRIAMTMNKTGGLEEPVLVESSGSDILDKAAMRFARVVEKETRKVPFLKEGYCLTTEDYITFPVMFSLVECNKSACPLP